MGSNQSVQTLEDEEDEEEDEDEEEEDENGGHGPRDPDGVVKKVLEQEPEMLPCYASASPLSPQLSSLGTPRMGPSIKVWDPYNVLAPPPPLPPPPVSFGRSYSSEGMMVVGEEEKGNIMEVYLISHGESEMSLRPDLISGRCPDEGLTPNGKRQARALAVFLNSQGVRFNAVYSSPLDRAKATAASVCQEMSFPEQQILSTDSLTDMSHGHWEGCPQSEMYTPEILGLIDQLQPDFSPPSGESLRQVEFRMVQFLNRTLLVLPEKLRSEFISPHPNDGGFSQPNSHSYPNPVHDGDGPSYPPRPNDGGFSQPNSQSYPNPVHDRDGSSTSPHWDFLNRHRPFTRKKSGKSRLQVTTTGDPYHEDKFSPKEPTRQSPINEINVQTSRIGVFTHLVPIKCLLTGILGCSSLMSHKLCIEDSSVTVLQHSWKTGWQIKRLNDTAHLRLL